MISLAVGLAGCGSGGESKVVAGRVAGGVVANGVVTAYSPAGKVLATGTTADDGHYRLRIADDYRGPLRIRVTAGSGTRMKCDDVSGCDSGGFGDWFRLRPGFSMSAVFPRVRPGNGHDVTPLSNLVAAHVMKMKGGLTADNVEVAHNQLQLALGTGVDLNASPVDITDPAVVAGASVAQLEVSALLAGFQVLADQTGGSVKSMLSQTARTYAGVHGELETNGMESPDAPSDFSLGFLLNAAESLLAQMQTYDGDGEDGADFAAASGTLNAAAAIIANIGAQIASDPQGTFTDVHGVSNASVSTEQAAKRFFKDFRKVGKDVLVLDPTSRRFDWSPGAMSYYKQVLTANTLALDANHFLSALVEVTEIAVTRSTSNGYVVNDGNGTWTIHLTNTSETGDDLTYVLATHQLTGSLYGGAVNFDLDIVWPGDPTLVANSFSTSISGSITYRHGTTTTVFSFPKGAQLTETFPQAVSLDQASSLPDGTLVGFDANGTITRGKQRFTGEIGSSNYSSGDPQTDFRMDVPATVSLSGRLGAPGRPTTEITFTGEVANVPNWSPTNSSAVTSPLDIYGETENNYLQVTDVLTTGQVRGDNASTVTAMLMRTGFDAFDASVQFTEGTRWTTISGASKGVGADAGYQLTQPQSFLVSNQDGFNLSIQPGGGRLLRQGRQYGTWQTSPGPGLRFAHGGFSPFNPAGSSAGQAGT